MLVLVLTGDENVVDVDENALETLRHAAHETLERLSGAFESEWHPDELPETEWSNDGGLGDVRLHHRNLHVTMHEIDL